MSRLDCKNEVIVDLFSGIGYFTLPFLVKAKAKLVYSCEWNPHAVEALHRNVRANSVADQCIILEGDNRITAPIVCIIFLSFLLQICVILNVLICYLFLTPRELLIEFVSVSCRPAREVG